MFLNYQTGKDGKSLKEFLMTAFTDDYLTSYNDTTQTLKLIEYIEKVWKRKMINAIKSIPNNIKILEPKETDKDLDMPTFWLESSDAFEMADFGDYSAINMGLNDIYNWIKNKSYIRKH